MTQPVATHIATKVRYACPGLYAYLWPIETITPANRQNEIAWPPWTEDQMISNSRMDYADGTQADGTREIDAFVLLGLVSETTTGWNETINCRRQVLHGFQTNIERFALLSDLQGSNPELFLALLRSDAELATMFHEVNDLVGMMVGI